MINLKGILSNLNEDQIKGFILYLKKRNKRSHTMNIELVGLLQNRGLSQAEICNSLYGTDNRAAYHALRKRIYRALIDFIASQQLQDENTLEMQLIKNILVAKTFLQQGHTDLGYGLLNKSQELAQEHYLFPILNEIYYTKIEYAYANPKIDIDTLIEQFNKNKELFDLENRLNMVYAKAHILIDTYKKGKEPIDFNKLLGQLLIEHNIDYKTNLSFKSLFQLMQIETITAFTTNEYLQTEQFVTEIYEQVAKRNKRDYQLYYHIHVVYIMANTLFRNKNFAKSLDYLDRMYELMTTNKKRYYKSFRLRHALLKSLNYNFIGNYKEAVTLVEQLNFKSKDDIEWKLDLNLSLAMFYFQQENFKMASKIFAKFYHTDDWYIQKTSRDWLLKKNLMEILLHIELNNPDLVESRIKSFKRSHFKYLKSIKEHRAISYAELVEAYFKSPQIVKTKSFMQKVNTSFEWVGPLKEDIFVMSFYAWLKAKIENRPIYETTLNLIRLTKESTEK